MDLTQSYSQELEPRLRKLAIFMMVIVGIIGLRLYYLQGIKGKFYRLFSEDNSIRENPIPALRGIMYDRNGVPLVDNRAAFDLIITPQYIVDSKKVFTALETYLKIPQEKLKAKWEGRYKQPAYQPLVILQDVPLDLVSWVKAHKSPWTDLEQEIDLRGVDIRLRYERDYTDGDIASHVLGYVREIDAERLQTYQKSFPGRYKLADQVGIRGLEEVWDQRIRGEDGYSQKVVNARGREIFYSGVQEELESKEALNGNHLKLTLDTRLHRVARDFYKGKSGATVAIDPRDGAVLLMYSAPSFDLNRLGGEEGNQYWHEISTNPAKYLLNRSIQGAYPPGSTYKIVTGTAALQEGLVKPDEKIYCGGGLHFGNRRFGCWNSGGHGPLSYHRGLVQSCDVYFYTLGLRVGVDGLARYARAFGLVTPLQSALMIATAANGGKRLKPYLVQSEIDAVSGGEKIIPKLEPKIRKDDVVLSKDVVKMLHEALVGVVAEPGGTAHRLSVLKIPMGGKTGTAQVVALGKSCAGGKCGDHAWFVAFAPAENPTIAISVVIEHGGHGSPAAAPLAGELIKAYLGESNEKESL